ncbi:GntR family transcriptional regulator [uncultured Pigmentiphaga sp.]|uniref:GntR family transcriptional regulator n=1 Tax=uncultured Pigmentiphaga sp. TaxID=340361 RepID=UPI002635171E|nr:GntR family transcriptional regulator [uncultured Pigmentiphaga sp.]
MPTAKRPRRKRRKAVVPELAGRILVHINTENFPPGSHLTAQSLADRFGASRWTVSQALEILAGKGVLRHEANRGYFVSGARPSRPEQLGLNAQPELTRVYFQIAEDRLQGRLDDHVTETYLRQTYHLTHRQLTELLSKISREGWAERRIGYGWTFSPILKTPESLTQTYSVRVALEPAALLEPTFRLAPEAVARLREIEHHILSGGARTMTADELYERAVNFHETLAEASQNPFFIDVLRRINKVRRLLVYRSMVDRERYYHQAEEHLHILDLLEAGRNQEAAEAMRGHLLGVMAKLRAGPGAEDAPIIGNLHAGN